MEQIENTDQPQEAPVFDGVPTGTEYLADTLEKASERWSQDKDWVSEGEQIR